MDRNIQKNGLVNLLALLVVGAGAFGVARYSGSLTGQVTAVFIGLGFLVALVSWFQMRLEESEQLEKFELEEMARSKAGSTLFEAKEAEIFPAQRARRQFERFFVPGFAVLLLLLEGGGAYLLWRWATTAATGVIADRAMEAVSLFGLLALILFLLGRFTSTIARIENHRLLRPSGSYLLLGAYLCVVSAAVIAISQTKDFPNADHYAARVLCGLLGVIAVETVIALVLEIYRPRLRGKVGRPLYDSRLVGLLGQPESLFTTAAHTLDYQFGFKVSETWFYRFFFERALAWLILMQLAALAVSTCVVFVEPGEQAVLERFGRRLDDRGVLEPGAHLKLPWPIDKTYIFPTERIQTVDVGYVPEPGVPEPKVVLWSVPHTTNEENFIVPSLGAETAEMETAQQDANKAPPVNLVTVRIPVQFQIRDLIQWVYNHQDSSALLQEVAEREAVRYLASADLTNVMSRGRLQAAETLRERIQTAADDYKIGADILFVGLKDIHPPVKVAADFEKVVAARSEKQASIIDARAEAVRTNALATAHAYEVTNAAAAKSLGISRDWYARAAAFTNQIPAYEAAPSVFMQRAYFQTFARATANAQKYVLLATNTDDVMIFDLQNKLGADLYNLRLESPPENKSD